MGTTESDVVAVLDDSFAQLFVNARPIKATVKESAKVMEHPVEKGSTVTDFRIIQPVEIELSMVLARGDYRNTYAQIKRVFERAALLTVQTRTGSYGNMMISSIPHDEDADMFDAVALALTLREVILIEPQYATIKPSNPTKANTVKRGEQQAQPVVSNSGSALAGGADYISGKFKDWFGKK